MKTTPQCKVYREIHLVEVEGFGDDDCLECYFNKACENGGPCRATGDKIWVLREQLNEDNTVRDA